MKTFSVAVVAAVLLALICLQESSALPLSEVRTPPALISVSFWADSFVRLIKYGSACKCSLFMHRWKMMPYTNIYKRRPQRCRFCCNCCPGIQGCGVCCRF
ncbi:hepcidin-like [Takifugu flavidus]|uniref:hepcidin-like n=1 Tax=Takifugu flavidus TaxID=433684 RepID=UPI002544BEB8|nr:hepcidin-like [Takifugu flavidus]